MCNIAIFTQAFPDALFHQLLQAMVCADHESRMGAHRIFSVVLVPSSVCPNSVPKSRRPADMQRTLSRTVSVFSSSAALFRKLKMEADNSVDGAAKIERVSTLSRSQSRFASRGESVDEEEPKNNTSSVLSRLKSSYSRSQSVKRNPSSMVSDQNPLGGSEEKPVIPLRLSSHQICLLLSSIWVQSLSPHNMPQNYEAIANTYSLVLLFGRTKNSSNEVLVWSFQLAFSLRNLSLGGPLQPSRRRSLFTLATSMIIFSARAFNIPPLVNNAKTALQEKTVDPFLQLVEDSKLDAVFYGQEEQPAKSYGSKEDDDDALISLVAIEETTQSQPREHYAAMIMKFLGKLSDQDASSIKEQLVSDFIPIDGCPVGTQLTESPVHVHRSEDKNNKPREMDETQSLIPEIDAAPTPPEDQLALDTQPNAKTAFLLSIDELLSANVLKKPRMQLDIVHVATSLAQQTKVLSSVAIIGALRDMIRHLRKSIHCSLHDSTLGNEMIQYNLKFETAVEQCLVKLSQKVGDAGPILDIMAVMLESMSNITVMARTIVSAVFRTAQIIAAIPNLSYENKAFPDALFHHLLQAMVCADHESRMGAHRIFSVVLVPSSVCPDSVPKSRRPADMQRTLSRTVSVFSSSAALFRKQKVESDNGVDDTAKIERGSTLSMSKFIRGESFDEEETKNNTSSVLSR
ncbi:hypothetical protein F2Q68_00007621 [Brassica cretica]|uniref:Uncharacterized protein n=1 Tax=Brassica cretica TaxID=69181 RepID=A0A8S9KY41_BRACR|nr:hypothetical protein F2Q68_00007621 [Brassica cretica]